MSDKRLRWGVIGTANIGRWAVNPAIQASSNGELVAVASRDEVRARQFADQGNIPESCGSYDELLADDGIEAVYIPLPNSLHREWTIKAVEAGKHVLCEKPLAMSEAECMQMSAAAEANGVKLMEAFMYRFHPRTEKVLQMLREGLLGDVRMISSVFTFRLTRPDNIRFDPQLGGGSLMDVGCYCVNLSRTAAGCEPVEVQAIAVQSNSGVDEMMAGSLRFPNDLLATFQCGLNTRRRESYEIGGTEGYLRVADAFLPGEGDVVIEEHRDNAEAEFHPIPGVDEYRNMVEHFARCVLDDTDPRYPATEAALNMRTIEALYSSVRAGGSTVKIPS
jgi:predicted dehydrogenase